MATTSLWKIKGRLKDLMEYVENPAKTQKAELQDFFNAMEYARNPEKTEQGYYVTAINCLKEIALQQMILTKEQFGKKDGIIAWHGYQSFKPGEVTAEECHAIGMETAKAMWGEDYQIIVTTHLDKDHLHNHFFAEFCQLPNRAEIQLHQGRTAANGGGIRSALQRAWLIRYREAEEVTRQNRLGG